MKAYLFSLFLLLALAGCSQDPTTGTTTVEGQVVEDQSHKPVPNASVQLYHKQNGGYQTVSGATAQSDAQGHYSMSFEATSTTGYFLTAIAAPGYFTPEQNAPYLTAGRANQNVTIAMLAPAWVRLQLVDVLPKTHAVVYLSGYEGPGDVLYYPRDTVLVRPLIAGFSGKIIWGVNETGVIQQYSQTIQVGALDTAKVRIAF